MSSLNSFNLKSEYKGFSIIGIIKIVFFIIASISFLTNIVPFYEGGSGDDYVYAIVGIDLTKGSYGYTNELWKETGRSEFIPQHWHESNQDVLVPNSSPGIIITSALSYLLGGYYGLLFLGPIFSILFLIISERVATKLFGSFVGLVALVFLGSDLIIFKMGTQLLTDTVFSIFFVLGIFYLIKFFQEKKEKLILLSSIFLVISAFFRFNGLISFPIEVMLVIFYIIYELKSRIKINHDRKFVTNLIFSNIKSKKFFKTSVFLILPWMCVLLFFMSYNDIYFGDPFSSYYQESRGLKSSYLISSFFLIDADRFDSIKNYSIEFLPDILGDNIKNTSPKDIRNDVSKILSIFSFLIIILAIIISLYDKNKRKEILVLTSFIMGIILFYSSDFATSIYFDTRFMIPALPLTFILFGFILQRIIDIDLRRGSRKELNTFSKNFKLGLLIIIGIFLIWSVQGLENNHIQKTIEEHTIINPGVYVSKYPLDSEGLSSDDIIVETKGRRAMEYEVSPFIPAKGSWVNKIKISLDPNEISQERIEILKKVIDDGHEAFTFKDHDRKFEPLYFRYLEAEQEIILKDFSKTFCKMVFIKNTSELSTEEIKSDDICYTYQGKVIP